MDLRDEIGTKGDKKHAKREAKARLKHKYYWVHKEEDILFNFMKAVYNILNNQDKMTTKHSYHIRCVPDLDKGFCDMRRRPCACNACFENSPNPGYLTWIKPSNHLMLLNTEHVSTLPSYMVIINGILPN